MNFFFLQLSSSGEMSKKLSDGSFKDPKAETEVKFSNKKIEAKDLVWHSSVFGCGILE